MTNKEFFQKGLPKWPALVVDGHSVTAEQAAEILIRTNTYITSNETEFVSQAKALIYGLTLDDPSEYDADVKAIEKILGVSAEGPGWNKIFEYREAKEKELGVLDIYYLSNHRICSSWIGGPHGWCNWDGVIGCHNYNIGKWPSVEDVYNEWKIIAKAFPFLELRCQLMNHEVSCEDLVEKSEPVVEFRISKGKVKMYETPYKLKETVFSDRNIAEVFLHQSEIGCSLETLKSALDYVRWKFKTNYQTGETQRNILS